MAEIEVLQRGWNYLISNYDEGTLITTGTLVAHEIFYFASFLPFLIADFIPALQKYKVQPQKQNTWPHIWKCLKYLFIVHFVVQWSMMLLFKPVVLSLGMSASPQIPSLKEILPQIVVFFMMEDFYFYWVHRFLHWGPMYKFIHKKHHDHAAPFGIAAEYAHPVESLMLGVGSLFGPMLLSRHLFTLWAWLLVRVYQTVEAHSGYTFPWNPTRFIPFWGGAHFHDFHHETFVGNYSSTFTYMDRIFGTSKSYYNRLEKRQQEAETKKEVLKKQA